MRKLCRANMALPHPTPVPNPIGLYLSINISSLSFLKGLLDNDYSVKHLMSKRKVGERLGTEVTRL